MRARSVADRYADFLALARNERRDLDYQIRSRTRRTSRRMLHHHPNTPVAFSSLVGRVHLWTLVTEVVHPRKVPPAPRAAPRPASRARSGDLTARLMSRQH